MRRALGICLDVRVLAGLGVIAVVITLVAPHVLVSALPVLLILACPLSMVLMAWAMRNEPAARGSGTTADRVAILERQQARLGTEIAQVRREVDSGTAATAAPSSMPIPSSRSLPDR